MLRQNLTAGAARALAEFAKRRAAAVFAGSPTILLLASLLVEESRGADLLRQAGMTEKHLADLPELHPHGFPLDVTEWERSVVRRADQFAIQWAEDQLTGTEHLLLAALELDPVAAEVLSRFGLTCELVLEHVRTPDPDLSVPDEALIQIRPAEIGSLERSSLFRILDASANRCREGLRVVEDYVRFHLTDGTLALELKEIRHVLTATLRHMGQERWVAARDTLHDVGTRSSLASERMRGSTADVVRASLKRAEEALRSLEEYGKLIDADLSLRISQCRYRLYTVELGIEAAILGRDRLKSCRLYLLVTRAACRYDAETVIKNTITAGVDVVQIREKQMPDRELLDYASRVRELTQGAGALLIINDRPDIAAAVGADGVHLGQDDMDVPAARRILGGNGLIGVSTHNLAQVREAVFSGADYIGVGPVFESRTKEFSQIAGLEFVSAVAGRIGIPWFAIGGINLANLAQVQSAGATRVAVSSVICGAGHPRGVSLELAQRLENCREHDEPA